MARSMTFVIDGEVDTRITITELDDGSLKFDVRVLGTGSIGDLRALFFDLQGFDSSTDGLLATSTAEYSSDITDQAYEEGGIDTLGQDANVKGQVSNELGDFDVGIEFGTSGAAEDDIQESSFILSYEYGGLSLDMLDLSDFGVRYTSVGDWDGYHRTGSEKTGATAGGVADSDTLAVAENDVASIDVLANDTSGTLNTVTEVVDENGSAFTSTALGFEKTIISGGLELGVMTVTSDGTATFDANGADVDGLAEGEQIEFLVTYTTISPNGSQATADITVTVSGVDNDVNIVDLHSNPSSDTENPTVFSGTDGQVDVFVYDFTVGRQDFEYMQVNNFNPDEDNFVFTNFELNGDGVPERSSNQPEGYESMQDRVDGDVTSLNGFNIIRNTVDSVITTFTNDTDLGSATDVIRIYVDDGVTGAVNALYDGNVGYADGPVLAQEDNVLVFEGDYVL